ncbi:MAG: CHAT domain-containing protein [Planctomycetia bacterium]|nr:CHAT domain-containing protein [Planctomycetia bacterium]
MLLDGLIVLDDIKPGDGPYDWSPAQLDRGKPGSALVSWFPLPWGGPEQIILPGFHTAAETGFRKGSASGEDLFLSSCGLMSAGARTILISRWRPGGQTSFDLVREFAQELPHTSPAEAWQRSVQIAQSTPIEPEHEPRVKKTPSNTDSPKASHPFFWSAYMLVDSGVVPEGQDKVLAIPGLNAPNKDNRPVDPAQPAKGGQPANPPLVRGVAQPAGGDPPGDPQALTKRGKKTKPQPRATPKKPPSRTKPAPTAPPEQ